ncbi:ankyrin, partial [Piromyces finnis]
PKPKLKNSKSDSRLKHHLETNDNQNIEEVTSPLHKACEKGFELKVKVYLDYGDDINLIDDFDNTPLHYACTYNRINITKILLQSPKINVDIKCCQSRITPFLCAAYTKNIEMMTILLEHGANINACDSNGASVLFNLCKDENKEVYKYLLDHHISVKIQDKSGMTILHQIAVTNKKELAELIINYDRSIIDYQDIYGKTALHYCAINNYKEIMKMLIENNANIKIKDKKNNNVVDYLIDNDNYTEDIKQLIKSLEHSDLKDFNFHSNQLIKACKKGDYEWVKQCLEQLGDNIYYVDESGRIALHYACESGNIDIVKLLLEKGSCINIYDNKFFTPLYLASFNGYYDISKLLLERGASSNNIDYKTFKKIERLQENSNKKNISSSMEKFSDIEEYLKYRAKNNTLENTKTKSKEIQKQKVEDKSYLRLSSTPLISAILNGQNDIVEELIKNGTNINEKDEQDLNPFYYACSINNERAIHLLIEKKVEIENYCDPLKTSVMHFACKYGNVELAERIIDCYAMFQGNISQSSIYLSRSHSRELSFERYCGVNEFNKPNMFGVTPFHWACLYGKRDIIKLFKNGGINIFIEKDINGSNALHHVCSSGNTESVRLILKYIKLYNTKVILDQDSYININEINGNGDSALHISVRIGNEDIVKLLIDNGINQTILNSNNQTAKQYAESIKQHNKKILELLN